MFLGLIVRTLLNLSKQKPAIEFTILIITDNQKVV